MVKSVTRSMAIQDIKGNSRRFGQVVKALHIYLRPAGGGPGFKSLRGHSSISIVVVMEFAEFFLRNGAPGWVVLPAQPFMLARHPKCEPSEPSVQPGLRDTVR